MCRGTVVLEIYVNTLLVLALGSVVQPEHLPVKRITVVGQQHHPVVHAERAFAVRLEIADGVPCIGEPSLTFEFAPYFHGLAFHDTFGYGHCFHREGISLLHIQLIVTGYQGYCHYSRKHCRKDSGKRILFISLFFMFIVILMVVASIVQ